MFDGLFEAFGGPSILGTLCSWLVDLLFDIIFPIASSLGDTVFDSIYSFVYPLISSGQFFVAVIGLFFLIPFFKLALSLIRG